MEYFRLLNNSKIPDKWWIKTPKARSIDFNPTRFTIGQPVESPPEMRAATSGVAPVSFTFAGFDVPVVDEVTREVISNIAGVDVDFSPILLNEQTEASHFILNVTSLVTCLDESKSVFTKWSVDDGRADRVGQYRMVPKLRLISEACSGHDIFRITGWDVPIIVSERLKCELEHSSVTGILFQNVTSD